ncbi:hypothetical protein UFOVP1131_101 [uncultured Caudovirales phage]|uniref:Uncharacterized protein n=1 Tax=uncultured Caudovirales phage TaxID=2100421 RepID=A0A6J5PTD7_9CAUD|nr:hypothetical protein UFOVP966_115 [uncultured Caudovirales phage]CAB4184987.1 hypothetical protein UFOVP1131_101 [uncultured Caudovirales phage]CAB4192784.1 hypothetical protein UFOVP1245_85 [uncultured Caudovirales phage]CAB5231472.1 hypothetical protein UFOVP1582_93 [uncultured Caudovirales phage]
MKRPATPAYDRLWTTAVALAVSLVLLFPIARPISLFTARTYTVPTHARDNWRFELAPARAKISGLATWYDASRNGAWYTRKSEWGKPVVFYAAAGPALRSMIEDLSGGNIKWGVSTWINMAKSSSRPKFLLTSKKTGKSVIIIATDWCGCQGRASSKTDTRVVDLSPDVWAALGVDLGLGVMRVTIEVIKD